MNKWKNIERVFVKDEKDDLENFVCNFCYASFETASDRDNHIEAHLIRKTCGKCKKSIILIGSQFYEEHGANCYGFLNSCGDDICDLASFSQSINPEETLAFVIKECREKPENEAGEETEERIEPESTENDVVGVILQKETRKGARNGVNESKNKKYKSRPKDSDSDPPLSQIMQSKPNTSHKSKTKTPKKLETNQKSRQSSQKSETKVNKEKVGHEAPQVKKKYLSRKLPKIVACNLCDKHFGVFRSLITHQKKVHSVVPIFQCHVCSVICKTSVYLKNHIDTHYMKKYICNYCGRGFNLLFNLREHIYDHTGERPYICEVCGKTFKRSTLKRNHSRQHTGEKPYKCDIVPCERAFAYSTDLRRHKRGAHGILTKPFGCLVCGKVFYENKFLRKHMETHTGKGK